MRVAGMTRMMTLALMITAAGFTGGSLAFAENPDPAKLDTSPGPAHTMVDGQVVKIEGEVYTVRSGYSDNGSASQSRGFGDSLGQKDIRIYVGKETKKIRGEKKVGDKIRAEVTYGGFANSIQ